MDGYHETVYQPRADQLRVCPYLGMVMLLAHDYVPGVGGFRIDLIPAHLPVLRQLVGLREALNVGKTSAEDPVEAPIDGEHL